MDLLSTLNFDNLTEGIAISIFAFGLVCIILAFIIIVITIISKLFVDETNNFVDEANNIEPSNTFISTDNPSTGNESLIDDSELIAVITAAIAASQQGGVNQDRLVVRRLKRVSTWNKEAIHEQQNRLYYGG